MRSIIRTLLFGVMMLTAVTNMHASSVLSDNRDNKEVVVPMSEAEKVARVEEIRSRVEEIKAMDKSTMTRSERRALRKELRDMKKESKQMSGGVYLSVGAVIIIILLLILIL